MIRKVCLYRDSVYCRALAKNENDVTYFHTVMWPCPNQRHDKTPYKDHPQLHQHLYHPVKYPFTVVRHRKLKGLINVVQDIHMIGFSRHSFVYI